MKNIIINEIIEDFIDIVCIKYVDKYDKRNIWFIKLYIEIIQQILLFYTEVAKGYDLFFAIEFVEESIKTTYKGMCKIIGNFINDILSKIDINGDFYNDNLTKYFELVKEKYVDILKRQDDGKSLHFICEKELYYSVLESKSVDEQIDFINNLTIDNFKEKMLLISLTMVKNLTMQIYCKKIV